MRCLQYLTAVGLCLALASAASARPRRGRRALAEVRDRSSSVSVGSAAHGFLYNGQLLPPSDDVRYKSAGPELRWGTDELVSAVSRAARLVAERLPGAMLTVGDVSRRGGGRFRPHRSHRSGRDVDLAFYTLGRDWAPGYPERFVRFRGDGQPRDRDISLEFDDKRNWELVASLLTDDTISVQHIFICESLEQRLLEEAERIGAPAELVEHAAVIMSRPTRGGRHDDHFHVRIYCDPSDFPACVDRPPYHPWHVRPDAELVAALIPVRR